MKNFINEHGALAAWAAVSPTTWAIIGVVVLFVYCPDAPFYFFGFFSGLVLLLPVPLFIIRILWERYRREM